VDSTSASTECPVPPGADADSYRYRVVPGQTGNLANSFQTLR
jgi:hypothetical protein